MKRSTCLNGLVAVLFWMSGGTGPATGATVAFDGGGVQRLTPVCAEPMACKAKAGGAVRSVDVAETGTETGTVTGTKTGTGLALILSRTDGAALQQAGPALALVRLFSAVPGRGDARLWLVDTGRTGGVGLFYLRLQRQTWTAGQMGDMPMDLPMAAMAATRSGALAFNAP